MKPKFRIIHSVLMYNVRYMIAPINDKAREIGAYCMYVDGIIRRPGYSILQETWK